MVGPEVHFGGDLAGKAAAAAATVTLGPAAALPAYGIFYGLAAFTITSVQFALVGMAAKQFSNLQTSEDGEL